VRYAGDAFPANVTTLAEILREGGYETAGFSENPWIGSATGMDRGFDTFVQLAPEKPTHPEGKKIAAAVGEWLAARQSDRPFFVFLNLMDPHWPYRVRDDNPYLPSDVSRAEASAVASAQYLLCTATEAELAILRGLYLGDVHYADAKLGSMLPQLERARGRRALVTVVTSDHGEYLGKDGFLEHGWGIGEPVIRVPLVVHGLPRTTPTVIEAPVQLADLFPSILAWAGSPVPDRVSGIALPTRDSASSSKRMIVAESWDPESNPALDPRLGALARWRKEPCGLDSKIFGDSRALIRFPYKLKWFERYPAELFDLKNDPGESTDVAATRAATVDALKEELMTVTSNPPPDPGGGAKLDASTAERLRALGYGVP
jgi:arylsulfatase A-like enzyme